MRVDSAEQTTGRPVRVRQGERGMTMVFVAVLLVVIFGMAALVVDLGNGWQSRRNLITATDAAALAAAQDYGAGLNGCSNQAASYVDDNFSDANLVSCIPGGTTAAGWVTVTAEVNVETWFASVLGGGDYDTASASTARWGSATTAGGLRPLSLCAQAFGIESWVLNPQAELTVRVDYTKDGDHPECDSGQNGVPGTWGMMDFNGVGGGNNDSQEWILNGYPDLVQAGTPNGTCVDEPWACYQPEPGNALPGVKKEINDILGQEITLPVVNWIVDENGQNAQMHIMGFANLVINDFKPTGQNAYIEVTFRPGLIDGVCCDSNGGPTNVFVVQPCAIDNRDVTSSCNS